MPRPPHGACPVSAEDRLYVHARLMPADPGKLRAEDMPVIPEWWPLPRARELRLVPADDGSPTDDTTENCNRVRHARAVAEACEGPMDGQRKQVRREADGSPPAQLVLFDGLCVYVRDDSLSNRHQAAYRYSPQLSPMHPRAMRAVEDGFSEYGKSYAEGAREDDTDAPGYASRG